MCWVSHKYSNVSARIVIHIQFFSYKEFESYKKLNMEQKINNCMYESYKSLSTIEDLQEVQIFKTKI
jgi:hypothetical protein